MKIKLMSQKERKKETKTHSLLQFFTTPKSLPTQLSDKNGGSRAGPTDPTPSNGSYNTWRGAIWTVDSPICGQNLVTSDDLRALGLDPTEPISERGFDLTFDRVNLILSDPLLPLHLRVIEAPRFRRPVLTRPSHSVRNRWKIGRVNPRGVHVVRVKALATHNL